MVHIVNWEHAAVAADNAGLDPEEALRDDYSGRGMYGETCFGIVVGGVNQAARFLVELAMSDEDATDLAGDLADAMRSDSMGYDQIYYFPGYRLSDPE